jgi:hypothetical protein
MQLRVLATAADSSKAWDLRCEIREKLIAYLQREYPESLPRFRADMGAAISADPGNKASPAARTLPSQKPVA